MGLLSSAANILWGPTIYDSKAYPSVVPDSKFPPQKNATKGVLKVKLLSDDFDSSGNRMSLVGQEVAIYSKGYIYNSFIGRGVFNTKNKCKLEYSINDSYFGWDKDFKIELIAKSQPFSVENPEILDDRIQEVYHLTIPDGTQCAKVDLEADYAYQSKDLTVVRQPPSTHWQSISWFITIIKAALPELIKAIFVLIFQRWLTASNVQYIFDSFGPQYPKINLTSDNLIDSLLNGICNVPYTRENEDYVWNTDWKNLELDHETLPQVEVRAFLNKDKKLQIDTISIKYTGKKEAEIIGFTNSSKEETERAIFIAFSAFSLKGEAEHHLGQGHLLPGVISTPFFKYVSIENPVHKLISGFLGQVGFTNYFGSLFGKENFLGVSGLAPKGIGNVIINSVNENSDWTKEIDGIPLNSQDKFTPAKAKHFNRLYNYFLRKIHENKPGVSQHWQDIYNWSEAVHASLPNSPPITKVSKDPKDLDLQRLARFMAKAALLTSFVHWVMHSRQYPLADIHTAVLKPNGEFRDFQRKFARDGNVSAYDAMSQLFTLRTSLNADMDSFAENALKDYPEELVKEFTDNPKDYDGFPDITNMFGCTSA
jgi:hypothetical protein